MAEKVLHIDLSGRWYAKVLHPTGEAGEVWCGPVVELPASNTLYVEVELPEMVFEYNAKGRLDSVFEAEI